MVAILLVLDDLLLLVLLFSGSLFLLESRLSVGFSSLAHEHVDSLALLLGSIRVFLLHFLDVVEEHLSLLVADLLLLHPLQGSLLNLVDDNLLATESLHRLLGIALLLFLEHLESFDFHH